MSGIDVPISLPTDASGPRAAADVVRQLEGVLGALGPAAEKGSRAAVSGMARMANAIANVKREAGAAQNAIGAINAKKAASLDLVNAKGAASFQLNGQKILGDLGKQRAKNEGAVELAAIRGSIQQQSQARAQAHAQEMARIKARAAAEGKAIKGPGKPAGSVPGAGGAEESGGLMGGLAAAGPYVAAAATVAAAIGAIVSKVADLTAQFYRALVSVQAFKEATIGAFSKLLGGAKQAQDAFKSTVAMAGKVGVGVKDALQGVNALIAKGFKADEAQNLVRAMADLKAVVPEANIGNLLLAITQIKSKGVLQMEELQGQIAEAGLSVSVVLEEIGKQIGKSAADVRKMIAAGKVGADVGVKGIMAAIQKTTGQPLGKAAEDAANSLGGLLARVDDLPTALLLAADASKGMGTVKGALSNVLAAFGPGSKSGDALAGSLGRMGDALSTFLSGLTGKSGGDALSTFVGGLAKTIDRMAAFTAKVGEVIGPRLGKAFDMIGKGLDDGSIMFAIDSVMGAFTTGIDVFLWTIKAVDSVRDAFDSLAGAIGKVGSFFSSIFAAVNGQAAPMGTAGAGIGGNLISGIIAGINMAAPGLLGVVGALANMTTASFKAPVKIASPSGVWRDEIGYQLPAGAAQGVTKGAPLLLNAAGKLAVQTTGAGSLGNGGQAGGGRSVVIEAGAFVFHGATRSDADFIEARIRAVLREVA